MHLLNALATLFLLSVTAPAFAQNPKSLQLDLQDPAIVEVRAIWNWIQDATASGELVRKHEVGDCSERTRWVDRAGIVRLYIDQSGTSDSAYTVRSYYDSKRRLRFIHATGGAVSGGELENRVWIGKRGEVLRDDFAAKGWPFMDFGDPSLWTLDPDHVEPSECHG